MKAITTQPRQDNEYAPRHATNLRSKFGEIDVRAVPLNGSLNFQRLIPRKHESILDITGEPRGISQQTEENCVVLQSEEIGSCRFEQEWNVEACLH